MNSHDEYIIGLLNTCTDDLSSVYDKLSRACALYSNNKPSEENQTINNLLTEVNTFLVNIEFVKNGFQQKVNS